MKRDAQLLRQTEFHVVLFFLFLLLFNWPFLAITGNRGLMSLFIYLHVLWAVLILLLVLIHRKLPSSDDGGKDGGGV